MRDTSHDEKKITINEKGEVDMMNNEETSIPRKGTNGKVLVE
jgi:hypothetical protein